MKETISFLCIGQCGGNIGQLFEKKGYTCMYVNTSKEDLKTLGSAVHTFHIPGGEGCHKDRREAGNYLEKNFELLLTKVKETLTTPIIYVIFSSGGGTGSGLSPFLIDALIADFEEDSSAGKSGAKVGAITVLPSRNEPIQAQINSYECLRDLEDVSDTISTFILDNNRGSKDEVNEEFVDLFDSFVNIPSHHRSVKGNIDRSEVKTMLYTHGAMVLGKAEVSEQSSTAAVIQELKDGVFAPLEMDGVTQFLATSTRDEVDLAAVNKEFGSFLDTYHTYNDEYEIAAMSGLSYPFSRMTEISELVAASKTAILGNRRSLRKKRLTNNVDFLSEEVEEEKKEEQEATETRAHKNPRDRLRKFISR